MYKVQILISVCRLVTDLKDNMSRSRNTSLFKVFEIEKYGGLQKFNWRHFTSAVAEYVDAYIIRFNNCRGAEAAHKTKGRL